MLDTHIKSKTPVKFLYIPNGYLGIDLPGKTAISAEDLGVSDRDLDLLSINTYSCIHTNKFGYIYVTGDTMTGKAV